jgi:hypothetical protein
MFKVLSTVAIGGHDFSALIISSCRTKVQSPNDNGYSVCTAILEVDYSVKATQSRSVSMVKDAGGESINICSLNFIRSEKAIYNGLAPSS